MIRLPRSAAAWGSPAFEAVFKRELAALGNAGLPLQQALQVGNLALDDAIDVVVLSQSEAAGRLKLKVSLFYTSVIAGCACDDDPTPVSENTECCELQVEIDRVSGEAAIQLPD